MLHIILNSAAGDVTWAPMTFLMPRETRLKREYGKTTHHPAQKENYTPEQNARFYSNTTNYDAGHRGYNSNLVAGGQCARIDCPI